MDNCVTFRVLLFRLNEVVSIAHLLKGLALGEWSTVENNPGFLALSRKGTVYNWLVGRLTRQREMLSACQQLSAVTDINKTTNVQ